MANRSSLRPTVWKPNYGDFVNVTIHKNGNISCRSRIRFRSDRAADDERRPGRQSPWAAISASRSVKAGHQFSVGCLDPYLKKGRYAKRLATGAPIYPAAVFEYLAACYQLDVCCSLHATIAPIFNC